MNLDDMKKAVLLPATEIIAASPSTGQVVRRGFPVEIVVSPQCYEYLTSKATHLRPRQTAPASLYPVRAEACAEQAALEVQGYRRL